MTVQTINPATEEMIAEYPYASTEKIDQTIVRAQAAFINWQEKSFASRKILLLKLAELLKQQQISLATIITQEMGKPITAALAEIEKCVWGCEHYAHYGEAYLEPRTIRTDSKKTYVSYHPLGIIFAVMPWNFPFWQVFRCAIPCIMAGNAVLLKHASASSGASLAINQLFLETGFPKGLFQNLILDVQGAAKVVAHPYIRGVSLTGSDKAGSTVAALAGQHLKKVVLELGGNDAYLVLKDADLELAANSIVKSRLNNCGQVCIAAKRIIVETVVREPLLALILEKIKNYTMGDPMDKKTLLGPMARQDLRNTVHQQVTDSLAKGAKLVTGGVIPQSRGFYYPVTILTDVKPGMPAFDEELFGPVIALINTKNEQEAIKLANNSRYGLSAAVFTQDLAKGEAIAKDKLEAGVCFVNASVSSDPRVPFGGIKASGFGRELSKEGILEFVYPKTVAIYDS